MGTWSEHPVAGHACDLFEPTTIHEGQYVVVYLHGVRLQRLRDQPVFTDCFERFGLRVVAPRTGRCWWVNRRCPDFASDWTPEQYVLKEVLPFIERHWRVVPPRIGLLGTSMGGQGALRFAYKYPQRFPVVAAISPAIDYQRRFDDDEILQAMYDDPEAARQDTAILHVHPLNWPHHQFFSCDPEDHRWWDSADRLRMKLYSLGVPHTCDLETRGGGHGFEYYNRMAERAVRFLVDGMEQERRK